MIAYLVGMKIVELLNIHIQKDTATKVLEKEVLKSNVNKTKVKVKKTKITKEVIEERLIVAFLKDVESMRKDFIGSGFVPTFNFLPQCSKLPR